MRANLQILYLALSAAAVLPAAARGADIKHGAELAQRWCSSCHVVAGAAPTPVDHRASSPSQEAI
jgi:mono/diheme cytochrome c family protein